jgi:tripartite-type tricarboxylate transporter receptor subunit TctC
MIRSFRFMLCLVIGLVAISTTGSSAQNDVNWPMRPVTLVIPNGPGGEGDTLGRLIAQKLTATFGQNFIAENRNGAGGLLAANDMVRARPDGYTLFVSSFGQLILANAIEQNGSLDPLGFTHIAFFGGSPAVIITNPAQFSGKTLKDFIAYCKSNPGKLDVGLAAYGSSGHLATVLLQRDAHIDFDFVPYRGGNDALVSLLGGHIPVAAFTLSTASKQLAAGRVRALAVASERRISLFPALPTFREQGFGNIVASNWFGLSGPAGIPAPIVNRLNAAVVKALKEPEIREVLRNLAMEQPPPYNAAAYTAFIKREADHWLPVAKSIRIH